MNQNMIADLDFRKLLSSFSEEQLQVLARNLGLRIPDNKNITLWKWLIGNEPPLFSREQIYR